MAKLNKTFKARWLKALRSGDYKQGETQLVSKDMSYCCLGVAGSLCGLTTKALQESVSPVNGASTDGIYLSAKIAGKIGLTAYMQEKLAEMNDTFIGHDKAQGKPYRTVIRYISRNL